MCVGSETPILSHVIRTILEMTCETQRRRMVIQRPQGEIPPLAINNTKEASGIAQRFSVTIREPQMKIMPPSKDIMKESDGFSRGQDMSESGPRMTISSHVIQIA